MSNGKMRVLDLFSGNGGFSLGLEWAGMETVALCEIESHPQAVLDRHWPNVPCYSDIKKLTKQVLDDDGIGPIDLICGGYPCQPFSLSGKRGGAEDDRHLWPEMLRLIQEIRPAWVIAENVAGHITMGLDEVLSDLEGADYAAWPLVIPAVAVDAPHRRDRVWIIANNERINDDRGGYGAGAVRRERPTEAELRGGHGAVANATGGNDGSGHTCAASRQEPEPGISARKGDVYHSHAEELQEREILSRGEGSEGCTEQRQAAERANWWPAEPSVGRVAHGVPRRVDRIKSLGNAVVPQIPEMIGRAIMDVEIKLGE